MIYIGINPSGGIAAIDDQAKPILCTCLPVARHDQLVWIDATKLTDLLTTARDGYPARITIERSQALPTHGISGTFTKGIIFGSILAACQRLDVPVDIIAAAQWKGTMSLATKPTLFGYRSALLNLAWQLFPSADLEHPKSHHRAEGLLIAEYSRRVWNGEVAANL